MDLWRHRRSLRHGRDCSCYSALPLPGRGRSSRSGTICCCLTAACLLFATAALMQIMLLPVDIGANTISTGLLYTLAVLVAAEAILRRSGSGMSWKAALAIVAVITVLLWYFYYIRPNLLVRIYVQAFGYGLILAATAWHIRALRHGRVVDRVLFWVVAVVAIHFFPRTWLTFGTDATASIEAFGASLFWNMMQLLIAAAGTALAFALLAAALTDVMDDLQARARCRPADGRPQSSGAGGARGKRCFAMRRRAAQPDPLRYRSFQGDQRRPWACGR